MPIDLKKYPKNWKTEIVPRIKERAKNCCEFCGVPNYTVRKKDSTKNGGFIIYGLFNSFAEAKKVCDSLNIPYKRFGIVVLTIAHLDHDAENHEVKDERLAALCQSCHINYDAKMKANRKKYGKPNAKQLRLL
jgi:hypothetical protein